MKWEHTSTRKIHEYAQTLSRVTNTIVTRHESTYYTQPRQRCTKHCEYYTNVAKGTTIISHTRTAGRHTHEWVRDRNIQESMDGNCCTRKVETTDRGTVIPILDTISSTWQAHSVRNSYICYVH